MILKALCDLAEEQGASVSDGDIDGHDLAFEELPVAFHVVLHDDGPPILQARFEDASPRRGEGVKKELVPRQRKRQGTAPSAHFLVDNAKFVFGVSLDPTTDNRSDNDERPRRFREQVEELFAALPDGSEERHAVGVLLRFLHATKEERRAALTKACERAGTNAERYVADSAQYAFEYAPLSPTPIHLLPAVAAFWRRRRENTGQPTVRCAITGKRGPVAENHPNVKRLPGATGSGATVVSFNKPAFWSYGLQRNENAPISRDAADSYVKALNSLLEPAPTGQNVRLSSDSVVVFWAKGGGVDWVLMGLEGDSPELVRQMLRTPQSGRPAALDNANAFYSMVLSGAQGRCVIRSFLETTIASAATAMDAYLADTAIDRPFGGGVGNYSLQQLVNSVGIEGRQATDTDASLATRISLSALHGRPFPATVLVAAVRRNRAEAPTGGDKALNSWNRFAARAALIRGALSRNYHMEVHVALDVENRDPAYLLGRLFAALNRVQQDALGSVNASIAERYYGAASSTPAAVFPTLLRRSQHHFAKLRRDRAGLAAARDKVVSEVMGGLGSFKRAMTLPEQGLFALGFHHQQQDFFRKKEGEK